MDQMDNDTQVKLTVEERLAKAEEKIADLKTELTRVFWLVVVVFLLLLGFIAFALTVPRSSEPTPSNPDASLQDLMHKGVHCYDSAQERGAARQRALAEIERATWTDKWEAAHPDPGAYPAFGLDGPPPSLEPSVRDTPMDGASWDAARCFEVT